MATRDPREIITPDAFTVAPELLGTPLASPWRRGTAMAVDGIFVAILSGAPSVFFGFAAAAFLFRASTPAPGSSLVRRSLRFAFRASGAIVLFVSIVATWGAVTAPDTPTRIPDDVPIDAVEAVDDVMADARDAPDIPGADSAVDSGADAAPDPRNAAAGDADSADSAESPDPDTLAALIAEIAELADELDESDRELDVAEDALEREQERSGIVAFVRGLAETVGLEFGWAALYFTIFPTLWNGRTPGKRLLGVRVVRLTGKPIGWWFSFERFGGYAAGVVTGLLGFAQAFWDPNRQAIHDKIAETVVVRDRDDDGRRKTAVEGEAGVTADPAAEGAPPPTA